LQYALHSFVLRVTPCIPDFVADNNSSLVSVALSRLPATAAQQGHSPSLDIYSNHPLQSILQALYFKPYFFTGRKRMPCRRMPQRRLSTYAFGLMREAFRCFAHHRCISSERRHHGLAHTQRSMNRIIRIGKYYPR
jgi:hypothetical protein